MINSTQRNQELQERGFIVLPALLDESQLAILIKALTEAAQSTADASCGTLKRDRGIYALRNVLEIEAVRDLAGGPIGVLMRELMGESARPVRGILFDKTPRANWKVPWHQDLTIAVRGKYELANFGPWSIKDGVIHVQPPISILQNMLTIRLHLDDCPIDNGALRILPDSHRCGRFDADAIAAFRQSREEVICAVERGGALLMKPLLLHASSSSNRPSRRRVLHLEWAAQDLPAPLRWI